MKCWHCETELIWGGDHDCDVGIFDVAIAGSPEDGDDVEDMNEEYSMVTNLSCPKCESFVLVYYPKQEADDE